MLASHKLTDKTASWDATRTVCNLVAEFYILLSIDDDLLLSIDRDDLGSAVRVTRVIDQPPKSPKKIGSQRVMMMTRVRNTYPRFPFFVASTTKSSSIRNK